MISLSRLLVRALVAGLGFSAALVASVVVGAMALGTVAAGERMIAGDESGVVALVAAVMRGGVVLPLFAAIVWPAWAGAVVLGEATGTRSLLVHLGVATAIAVVGVMGGAPVVGLTQLQATAAIGLTAGFVHWLIAGRGAGVVAPRSARGDARPPHDEPGRSAISQEERKP
jgi:hypothetical protein